MYPRRGGHTPPLIVHEINVHSRLIASWKLAFSARREQTLTRATKVRIPDAHFALFYTHGNVGYRDTTWVRHGYRARPPHRPRGALPVSRDRRLRRMTDRPSISARLASLTSFFPIPAVRSAGISRDSLHKRRNTGGKQKPWRKKRKYVPPLDLSATRATQHGPLATRFYYRVSAAATARMYYRARRAPGSRSPRESRVDVRSASERDAWRVCVC